MRCRPTNVEPPEVEARVPTLVWLARGFLAVAVVFATIVSVAGIADGQAKLFVLPLAAVAGLCLAVFAATRFDSFVLLLLGLRASVDSLQFGGGSSATARGGGAATLGITPASLLSVLFLLAALLWLAARLRTDNAVKLSGMSWALIVFWLAAVASLSGSHHISAGGAELLRMLSTVLMFIVLEQLLTSRTMMKRALVAVFASALIPLSYTLYGLAIGHPATEVKQGFTRVLGTFAQSNGYARYLALIILFGLAIYPYVKGRLRTGLTAVLVLSGIFLVLTLVIGALIATAVGIVLLGLLQRRTALVVAFIFLLMATISLAPGLSSRIEVLQTQQQIGGQATGNSLEGRFSYWTEVLPLANSNPVTGIGLDATQYETDAAKQPHNDFLRAYVETGVIGLLTYVAMLCTLIATCARAFRRTKRGTTDNAIAAGALVCVLGFALESTAANVITEVSTMWYLLAFVAVASYVGRTAAIPSPSPQAQQAVVTSRAR